jgi:hypothetical protein
MQIFYFKEIFRKKLLSVISVVGTEVEGIVITEVASFAITWIVSIVFK